MCGRYTIRVPFRVIAEALELVVPARDEVEGLTGRYNVAPSQTVPAVRPGGDGAPDVVGLSWGLLPAWAKDAKGARRPINARADGVDVKPTFRNAFRRGRCLMPADGFYEWRANEDGTKQPYFIRLADNEPFAFAGLSESWHGGEVESCALITTTPNDAMRPIHDRMPVILRKDDAKRWLDPKTPHDALLKLLHPYEGKMQIDAVSTRVNNARQDDATLHAEIDAVH